MTSARWRVTRDEREVASQESEGVRFKSLRRRLCDGLGQRGNSASTNMFVTAEPALFMNEGNFSLAQPFTAGCKCCDVNRVRFSGLLRSDWSPRSGQG